MERNILSDSVTAHIIAVFIVFGFFATVLITLLGFVDMHDATTASLVGIVMGYVAGAINPVLNHYFRKQIATPIEKTEVRRRREQSPHKDEAPPQ